jgi:hypothetical protein
MHASLLRWSRGTGWVPSLARAQGPASLIFYFGASEILLDDPTPLRELRAAHPGAVCAGCSTAGEIAGGSVSDGTIAALLIRFDRTRVRGACVRVGSAEDSAKAGAALGRQLAAPDLRHVIVLSDGLLVNGSQLTESLRTHLPDGVHATGGLAGDGARFQRTATGLDDDVGPGRVVGVGFYGEAFHVAYGSAGGWEPFGPKRLVTQSKGNVLYQLDNQPALALYKRYLGERAAALPAAGLLFPLQILPDADATSGLVRTILAVDEKAQSLTFAGDIPMGHFCRLMKAGAGTLVEGAGSAAGQALMPAHHRQRVALLVSCVGRKLVLGQRVEEEIEAVLARLGAGVCDAGFYSYGEISPAGLTHGCELHNQTMTLTVFSEAS